jgi:serine/threonine protein kinase
MEPLHQPPEAVLRRILAAQEWCQQALLERLAPFAADRTSLTDALRALHIGETAVSRLEALLRVQERIASVDLERVVELPEPPHVQIFSGRNTADQQPVLVLTSGWVDRAQLQRFHKEVALLKQCSHNHVARLVSAGENRGLCFAVFAVTGGYPLQTRLADAPLPEAEALWLMRQFANGLSAQLALGLGSRYATPQALWIVRDEDAPLPVARVVDIGMMRNLCGMKRQAALDAVDYLSPEQVRGQQPDERSLVYHCGAILYHALVGSPPFSESDPELVRKAHLFEEVPALQRLFPDLDPATCELVATAMSKDPAERCATLADFQLACEQVLERKGLLLSAPSEPEAQALEGLVSESAPQVFEIEPSEIEVVERNASAVISPFADADPGADADADPFSDADREAEVLKEQAKEPVVDITSRILAKHAALKATGRIRAAPTMAISDVGSPLQVPPTSADVLLEIVAANGWLDAPALGQLRELCRQHISSSAGLLPRDIIPRLHGSRLLGMEQVVELRATLVDQAAFPRYRFGKQLGVGTLGRTYVATDTSSGEQVVCKIFRVAQGRLATSVRSEFDSLSRLRHPRLVTTISCEKWRGTHVGTRSGRETELCCAVSRRIVGVSLRSVLGGDRPAPEAWSIRVIQQVAEGLMHLHARSGQYHLGLGLGNILLHRREDETRTFLPGEQVVVADCGFASLRASRTRDLPWYAAPELHAGTPPSANSDVWSLGALLMRMLSGEPPLANGRRRAALPPGLQPLTVALVERALAAETERHADLTAFAEAITETSRILAEISGSRLQTVGARQTPRPESAGLTTPRKI